METLSKCEMTSIRDLFFSSCSGRDGLSACAQLLAKCIQGDDAFLDLKNYEVNPHRAAYGWTSNNSVFARIGMDYTKIAEHITKSGEPGLAWLENMRSYGRMCDPADHKDHK